MDKRIKIIRIGLWTLVIVSILLFVVLIIVEHSLSNGTNNISEEPVVMKLNLVNDVFELGERI